MKEDLVSRMDLENFFRLMFAGVAGRGVSASEE